MTRLTASPAARAAAELRKLEHRASIIRGRVEAMPGCYQTGPLVAAENLIALRLIDKARAKLDEIDEALEAHQAKISAEEMAKAGQDQARLLAERGIETHDEGVVKTRDGWRWLRTRKPPRLTSEQISTGDDYARLYALAMQDTLSTSSNDNQGGGEGSRLDHSIKNRERMDVIQRHIADATGSTRLIALLDAVCGRGETIRSLAKDDERRLAAIEAELRVALDMACVGFKIVRQRDRDLAA